MKATQTLRTNQKTTGNKSLTQETHKAEGKTQTEI